MSKPKIFKDKFKWTDDDIVIIEDDKIASEMNQAILAEYRPNQARGKDGRWIPEGRSGGSSTTRKLTGEDKKKYNEFKTVLEFFQKTIPRQTQVELKYHNNYDMVLRAGQPFIPQELPEGIRIGEKRMCYKNAANLALDNPDYRYVEGFAMEPKTGIPIEHAWVADKSGNVIDNTWSTPGRAYIGIPISTDFLRRQLVSKGTYGLITGEYVNPYLKDGLPDKATDFSGEDFIVISELLKIVVAEYNPRQPRDKLGKWTSGLSGVSEVFIRGQKYEVVTDVSLAVKKILNNERVYLQNTKQFHTVLKELAKIAQDAKAKGEEAPNYDLTKVSAKGMNIFAEAGIRTKEFPNGIPRISMPQIGGKPRKGSEAEGFPRNPWDTSEVDGSVPFMKHLADMGIKTTSSSKPVASLAASQRELVGPKVAKMMVDDSFDIAKNPIFITKDNYIVDGHHRWAANVGRDAEDGVLGNRNMPVRVIDASISDVLAISNQWAYDVGLQAAAGVVKEMLDEHYQRIIKEYGVKKA